MVLRTELGISGPNPKVYLVARQIAKYGFTKQALDVLTTPTHHQTPTEERQALLINDRVELSAISAIVIKGLPEQVNYHDLQVAIDVPGDENPQIVPANFEALRLHPAKDRRLFQLLASAMTTTYSIAIFERMNYLRDETTERASEHQAMLTRTDTLLGAQIHPDYLPGDALEGFIVGNLEEAANFQSALLRMIPSLARQRGLTQGLAVPEQIALFQQIAAASEQLIRDFSQIPSAISRFVGETFFAQDEPGLWDSILLASSADLFLEHFMLVQSDKGIRVDFSASLKQTLATKAAQLQMQVNPTTGLPFVTADNWFGCPGIHKLDGRQVNVDMWGQYVALAPEIYELQAA